MRRLVKSVLLAAAILVTGCLAAACVQGASGAVTTASPSASAPATVTAPPSPTPSAASPPAAPSTAPPATPASSSPVPSSGSGFNLIWLWAVLGGLVLVGIIVLATRSPGRSAAAVNWRVRAGDAYKEGGHFDSAVREGEHQGAFLDPDSARWHDIQHRADNLTEALYILRDTARTEGRRAQVADALAALRAVRHALDAQSAPGGAAARQSGTLHSGLLALESSLNALRVGDDPLR